MGRIRSSSRAEVRAARELLKISPPDIEMADRYRDQHHGECVERVGDETEWNAVALGDTCNSQVRRRPDQRAVAAQTGTERQAPPQRLDLVRSTVGWRHRLDQWNHRGDERDVVDDC